LRRRLESDRYCYGFFHPAIPDAPLIFVEVALTDSISNNIANLLQQDPPGEETIDADTAVFYSINNCLLGLRGVSFGNFLIKQVVEHLAKAQPGLTAFVTLSPVPGFMQWLRSGDKSEALLNADEVEAIDTLLIADSMRSVLNSNSLLYELLPRLCAFYLVNAKSRGKPLDPVAGFHLGNGARLERINWMADSSDNGIAQSAGIMVNYVYDKQTLAFNHEAYEHQNKMIVSSAIQKLLA
jgi:malonyl-CoA decarboxylase